MHYTLNGKYPLETEDQVKTASEYFSKYLQRFNPMERITAAVNIEKRAATLGVDIEEPWVLNYSRVMKKAAQYSPDFESSIKMRKEACAKTKATVNISGKSIAAMDFLDKMASQKNEIPGIAMMKGLQEFDKLANLEQFYDNDILDPVMSVFGSLNNPKFDSVKVAGDLTNYDLMSASMNPEKMEKISRSFGKNMSERFKTGPIKTASDMTSPEQSLLQELVK